MIRYDFGLDKREERFWTMTKEMKYDNNIEMKYDDKRE